MGIDLEGSFVPCSVEMNKVVSETTGGSMTFQKGDMLRLDFE